MKTEDSKDEKKAEKPDKKTDVRVTFEDADTQCKQFLLAQVSHYEQLHKLLQANLPGKAATLEAEQELNVWKQKLKDCEQKLEETAEEVTSKERRAGIKSAIALLRAKAKKDGTEEPAIIKELEEEHAALLPAPQQPLAINQLTKAEK